MSFKCGFCNKSVEHGTKPVRVVTKRGKFYPFHPQDQLQEGGVSGWEIASETYACSKCAEERLD